MALQKTHIARPTAFDGFISPVDIVIPFHGQYGKVADLVKSIFRFTFSNSYRIYLVDDCSPNIEFGQSLNSLQWTKCVRSETQLGFGGAMNLGFKQTSNSWIVFIQSDCLVEDTGWLKSLGESLQNLKSQGVRMVSPRTNNPLGDERHEVMKSKKDDMRHDLVLTDVPLPMYCFMVHRELFNRVGGFVKSYPYGYYEDEEFAYRLNKHGYKQGIAGKSWIYHEGQATYKDLWRKKPETLNIMEDNRGFCIEDMRSLKR